MAKYTYKKRKNYKLFIKLSSLGLIVIGAGIFLYTFFPLFSWQFYFAPAFASAKIDSPVPNHGALSAVNLSSLIGNATENINRDYTNAYNWYPGFESSEERFVRYKISFPSIGIDNATVNNENADLTKHLVQFNTDTHPPEQGNTIIFGHSTLPQLYDPLDYKTIFANAYKLKVGDEIIVNMDSNKYTYKIESITVVEPEDTSVLAQNFSDSFITVITCTPPGTIWKRLIVKARLESF
jgi:sortase A